MNAWINQIFKAGAVAKGGVVRRNLSDVIKYAGSPQALLVEVKRRNYHLVQTGNQLIVICNSGDVKIHC